MNMLDTISLLSLFFYAIASVAALAGLLARSRKANRMALMLTMLAFALHSALLVGGMLNPEWNLAPRSAYLPPVAWGLVAVSLGMWWKLRFDSLLLFAPPLAFLLLFIALILHNPASQLPATLTGPLFFIHLAGVSVGIGLMAVASGAAVVFLWQEKTLKSKKGRGAFRNDVPALSALDRINALATLIGFPAYSLGMLCGFVWARMAWGTLLSGDPKELISLCIWVAYGLLFHQRQALGWQGRKPALLALAIFGASLFSLFVVNMLFSTHHSFDALS